MADGVMPSAISRFAIEHNLRPQAANLLIAGHVTQFRQLLQFFEHSGCINIQFFSAGIFERVLELRAAHPVLYRNILHRLHKQSDASHLRQFRLQAADDSHWH